MVRILIRNRLLPSIFPHQVEDLCANTQFRIQNKFKWQLVSNNNIHTHIIQQSSSEVQILVQIDLLEDGFATHVTGSKRFSTMRTGAMATEEGYIPTTLHTNAAVVRLLVFLDLVLQVTQAIGRRTGGGGGIGRSRAILVVQ